MLPILLDHYRLEGRAVHEAHLFGLLAGFRMVGLLIRQMRPAPSILG
ncbi:hypothetical protein ACIRP7_13750 [Streptomyces sp. NPDC102270]